MAPSVYGPPLQAGRHCASQVDYCRGNRESIRTPLSISVRTTSLGAGGKRKTICVPTLQRYLQCTWRQERL